MRTRFPVIRGWMQTLPDAALMRVADATVWDHQQADQCRSVCDEGYYPDRPGCLVCHASGNEYDSFEGYASGAICCDHCGDATIESLCPTCNTPVVAAEVRYMRYAQRHGEVKAGLVMQRMARAVLARRALASYPQHETPRTLESVVS